MHATIASSWSAGYAAEGIEDEPNRLRGIGFKSVWDRSRESLARASGPPGLPSQPKQQMVRPSYGRTESEAGIEWRRIDRRRQLEMRPRSDSDPASAGRVLPRLSHEQEPLDHRCA